MRLQELKTELSARVYLRVLTRVDAVGAYAVALTACLGAVIWALIAAGYGLGSPTAVLILCGLALAAERESIRLSPTLEVSTASLPVLFAAVLFGPLAAAAVAAAGLLVDLARRDAEQPYLRWAIWTGSRSLVAAISGLVAAALGGMHTHSITVLLAAVAGAAAAEAAGDLVLGPIPSILRRTASWRDLRRDVVPLQLASIPLHVPVITVLAFAYRAVSPWSVALFLIPAFAAQRLFLLYRQQRDSAEQLSVANSQLERANLSFATALVATLDARDRYTAGHSTAVAIYARDIAARMGLPDGDQQKVHLCGLVHDIGKIGLPPGLLEKPGSLTLDERRQMEEHPIIAERILKNVKDYAEIAEIVRHHHERVDGMGYPDRLTGESIPLLSRIIAVSDAYNAMTSDRAYREAMPSRVARLRIAQAVETQFDTSVVAAFEAILAGADETYRTGTRRDFTLEAQDDLKTPLLYEVA